MLWSCAAVQIPFIDKRRMGIVILLHSIYRRRQIRVITNHKGLSMKILPLLAGSALLSTMLIAAPGFAQEQDAETTQDDDFHKDDGIVVTAPYFERLDLLAGTSSLSGEALAAETKGQISPICPLVSARC